MANDHTHIPCAIAKRGLFGIKTETECVYCGKPMGNEGETAAVRRRRPAFVTRWSATASDL